jgi:hypothetical protein
LHTLDERHNFVASASDGGNVNIGISKQHPDEKLQVGFRIVADQYLYASHEEL